MDANYIISQLGHNAVTFAELLSNVPPELITWRSQPDKWNHLEVACHLVDEEKDDFRTRLRHVLEENPNPFPPIDPVKWVIERGYASRNFEKVVEEFIYERKASVTWLASLKNPDWSLAYRHPKFGPLSGRLFLSNWLAHDYLHFRQLTKLKFDYLSFKTGEKLQYAGNW